MIRMFLPVLPGTAGDIPFSYLTALRQLSLPVRALPIGTTAALTVEKRWYDISDSFTVPMSIPFINVVCAPAGLLMGVRMPIRKSLASDEGVPAELRQLVGGAARRARSSDGDVVYEPPTALTGLWTVGVKNIAIIYGNGKLEERELAMLAKYDRVLAHESSPLPIAESLYVPPDPQRLAGILGEACGSVGVVASRHIQQLPEKEPARASGANSSTRPFQWLRSLLTWRR